MASAKELQRTRENNRDTLVNAFHATLKEFGYPTMNRGEVASAVDSWEQGKRPATMPEMFVYGWLEKGT